MFYQRANMARLFAVLAAESTKWGFLLCASDIIEDASDIINFYGGIIT